MTSKPGIKHYTGIHHALNVTQIYIIHYRDTSVMTSKAGIPPHWDLLQASNLPLIDAFTSWLYNNFEQDIHPIISRHFLLLEIWSILQLWTWSLWGIWAVQRWLAEWVNWKFCCTRTGKKCLSTQGGLLGALVNAKEECPSPYTLSTYLLLFLNGSIYCGF